MTSLPAGSQRAFSVEVFQETFESVWYHDVVAIGVGHMKPAVVVLVMRPAGCDERIIELPFMSFQVEPPQTAQQRAS